MGGKMKEKVKIFLIGVVSGLLIFYVGFIWHEIFIIKKQLKKDPIAKHILKGDYLKGEGLYKEAIEEYKEALKINPYDLRALERLAEIYMETGKYNEASQIFEAMGRRGDSFALYRLGEVYWRMGKIDEAFRVLKESAEMGNPLAKERIEIYKEELKKFQKRKGKF